MRSNSNYQEGAVAQQLTLLGDEQLSLQELEQQKARELYSRSGLLRKKYSSFAVLMQDPLAARHVLLGAGALARSELARTRGR